MKRAFTLIELLVVIAIIAILAAILFPVFAQAKAAAKKTTAISNIKQMGTALNIYTSDVDDVAPLMLRTNKYNGSSYGIMNWIDLLYPYSKNYNMIYDPVSPYNIQAAGGSTGSGFTLTPIQTGYFGHAWFQVGALPMASSLNGGFTNFLTRVAPWFQNYTQGNLSYDGVMGAALDTDESYYTGTWKVGVGTGSKSLTALSNTGNYALMFSSNNFDGWHGVYGQQVGLGYCGGWVGYDYSFFGFQPRHTGGSNVCDVNTRQTAYGNGLAIVGFADTHAKALKAGNLLKSDGAGRLAMFSPDAN